MATAPGQVWCWDVTFLPAQVQGRWFYLFLILDLYSRKIVGHEVHETDQAEHAAHLVRRTALAEGRQQLAGELEREGAGRAHRGGEVGGAGGHAVRARA